MKKLLFEILLITASNAAYGQLEVYNNGNATIGSSTQIYASKVTVGESFTYSYPTGYNFGLHSRATSGSYCVAIKGSSCADGAYSIGVQGIANGGTSGHLFGVFGGLNDSSKNGAGVFGTLTQHTNISVTGRYAGYFYGPVKATGDISAPSFITTSDIRLKENIITLSETGQSALDNVLDMNVIRYNYIDCPQISSGDTATVMKQPANVKKEMHYGLSAQELRQIYPDLVKEGQDGYLGVNYIELVPILIRSIQELKQELDNVRGNCKKTRTADDDGKKTQSITGKNKLYQNTPNPFTEQTTIRFSLADEVQNAAICIFDMTGKTIKKLPISSGMESVSIGGYELGEGMFLYSLVVNGQEIDTKRMIISK